MLGILGARFQSALFSGFFVLGVLSLVLALAALLKHKSIVSSVFVSVAFLFAGATLGLIDRRSVRADSLKHLLDQETIAVGDPIELTGALDRHPETAPGSFYLTLQVEQLRTRGIERNASGAVTLFVPNQGKASKEEYDSLELRYGARVRLMTALKRADSFRNPGVSSFAEYLERKGYDAAGFVKSPLLIERLDDERVFLPLAWLYDWRQEIQQQINSRFTAETAGVLNASLLGNRYFLSHATAQRFREGGTFHVLVISGLHISFIGGLMFMIAQRITRKKVLQFVFSTTVLWCYAVAVGAEASVVRAALMFTLVAFARVIARRGASLNALGAAALVLLVRRPNDLFDPSFQLTFLSVLAIVVFAWPVLQRMSEIGSWRPTRTTPYPPSCSTWLRSLSESLFWNEQKWKRDMARLNYSYKLFKAPLAEKLRRYHHQRLLRYLFGATLVSLSVQLTLLPFLILYFHRVSFASLILNIGVSVLMAISTLTAVAGLIIAQGSSALAEPLINIAQALNWLMVHSVDPFAWARVASLRVPEYSGWGTLVYGFYYVPLALLAAILSTWNPFPGSSGLKQEPRMMLWIKPVVVIHIIVLAVILVHPLSSAGPDGRLHVDFLDVGQGDSTLVTMPDGTTLLIDGGGRPNFMNRDAVADEGSEESFERDTRSVGEAVVSEHLWWRGLDHVDYILATHADADHIDGLNDVARNFAVNAALVARAPADDPEYAEFTGSMDSKGIAIREIGAGDVLHFGAATANVLWPRAVGNTEALSRNDDSAVVRLRFGERTILLTGDIESIAEAAILEDFEARDLRADVVKVAHHGSRTSSTDAFIRATRPRLAVISVSQPSVFGHPHKDVVERWKTHGAEVLTTGSCGMITVTTDGRDLRVETFVNKCSRKPQSLSARKAAEPRR